VVAVELVVEDVVVIKDSVVVGLELVFEEDAEVGVVLRQVSQCRCRGRVM
jgi:hypothetical protein